MRSLNGALLDDQPGTAVGDDPTGHAERERHGRTRGMAGRKADEHGAGKVAEHLRHHRTRGRLARWLVALRQLTDDNGNGPREETRLTQLRDHAVQPVRPL